MVAQQQKQQEQARQQLVAKHKREEQEAQPQHQAYLEQQQRKLRNSVNNKRNWVFGVNALSVSMYGIVKTRCLALTARTARRIGTLRRRVR